jgi:two-component system, cell cycle sensor histidine kinase and response regulator CckA
VDQRQPLGPRDLSQMLGALREGVQIVDRAYRYIYLNRAAAEHARRDASELLGRSMSEVYPGIERSALFSHIERCMREGVPSTLQNEFTYPDGEVRSFSLHISACDEGVVVLSIDVTEARRTEAQLLHAQKMEAVGRLAGSVAHDFNNLLSVILGYSSMLLMDLEASDPLRPDIDLIRAAGEKAAGLTRQLLAFSRQQVLEPRLIDLNELLSDAERMLRRLLGEDVELLMLYDESIPRVLVDPGQIDQVVMNLAVNARDAMPDGGKLTIETKATVLDADYASDHLGVSPGNYVMLAVSDTGVGMDKETQSRIFEPFFTTKEAGKGTGLGLSTVFGIVRQSGGNVWVHSEPGKGTSFKVYLPVARREAGAEGGPAQHDAPVEPATLQGTETILLVEDQDEVRRVAQQILSRAGYHVIAAANAGEALICCERHPGTIHLLLTDLVMPQMSGHELAGRLVPARPEMRVLYMSGYTDRAILQQRILDSGLAYVQKPLVPERLARRVREVLDSPQRRSILPPAG